MKKIENRMGIQEIIPADEQLTDQMKKIKGGGLIGGKKCRTGCSRGKVVKGEVNE